MWERKKKHQCSDMVFFCPIFLPVALCMCACYVRMFVGIHSHVRNKAERCNSHGRPARCKEIGTAISVTVPAIHPRSIFHCEQVCGP